LANCFKVVFGKIIKGGLGGAGWGPPSPRKRKKGGGARRKYLKPKFKLYKVKKNISCYIIILNLLDNNENLRRYSINYIR
jgi:hypothetical protein